MSYILQFKNFDDANPGTSRHQAPFAGFSVMGVEEIAAGLSEHRIFTLTRLADEFQTSRVGKFSEAEATNLAFDGLAEIGTAESGWYATFRVSPLGLSVLNQLIKRETLR